MDFIARFILKAPIDGEDERRLGTLLGLQKKQKIHFLDDFLDIDKECALDTTRIGYIPRADVTDKIKLAPSHDMIKPENRRLSRYRLVHGPVPFYLERQFDTAHIIPVITACAPNLMGSSQIDLDEFSEVRLGNRVLKQKKYKDECDKLAAFIVSTAKDSGHQRLIMPGFGVGVYIKMLDRDSQRAARQLMYQAFASAAERHQIYIDWIVWALDKDSDKVAGELKDLALENQYMNPIIHKDMLLYAKERVDGGEDVVILNPGSDRTIGGAYTHENPKTLEEQIAQQSDLVLLHSVINESLVDQFNKDFQARKMKTPNKKTHVVDFKALSAQIESLGVQEKPWIFKASGNYKISFKDQKNAENFSQVLKANSVLRKNGDRKTVQQEGAYYVVYLTPRQFNQRAFLKPVDTSSTTATFRGLSAESMGKPQDMGLKGSTPESSQDADKKIVNGIVAQINRTKGKTQKQKLINNSLLTLNQYKLLYDGVIEIKELNTHKNPCIDKFFGIKNTTSWRNTLSVFRNAALKKLFDEVDGPSSTEDKVARLKEAKTWSLFKDHRNNSIFSGAWGRTASVKKIEEKIDALELKSPIKPNP